MSEKNELKTIQEGTFSYDFKPAELTINNYEDIQGTVKEIAKHYKNTVFEEDDLDGIRQAHQELNSFRKGLEEGRKNVKREYNKPLKDFERDVKSLVALIDEALDPIKEQRDEILDAQEEARREALNDYLERQIKDTNVRMDDLEIEDSWTNKGNWTKKLNPRKKLKEEIERHLDEIKEEYKRKIAERNTLEAFLDEKDMDHEGWISQLEYRDALEIIQEIQRTEAKKKEAEKERAEQEAEQAKRNNEQNEANDELRYDKTGGADLSGKTGEVVEQIFDEEFDEPEMITKEISVTGTQEQLEQLNEYMNNNNIVFEPIIEETTDDLPW